MQYDQFLKRLGQVGGPADRGQADAVAKVVLATLGQRLTGNEPTDLASQLPPELKDPLQEHAGQSEQIGDVDDFLRRVADREGPGSNPDVARAHTRAVLATLGEFVSPGEIKDLRSQLPAGYAPLFH